LTNGSVSTSVTLTNRVREAIREQTGWLQHFSSSNPASVDSDSDMAENVAPISRCKRSASMNSAEMSFNRRRAGRNVVLKVVNDISRR